jgi:RES domain-containing protein
LSPARRGKGLSLDGLPAKSLDALLVRCVPKLGFDAGNPPSYFFASGRANRLNPAGVYCLYFSEDETTANAEYRKGIDGTLAPKQPKLTFHAKVHLRHCLDLGNREVTEALGVRTADLYGAWRGRRETKLQRIGRAVSEQRRISSVRFPSAASRAEGSSGWNIAIFKDALTEPDRVEILGDGTRPLEVLP